ncbi:MAG: hypothetical protein AB7P49_13590 [Bdellovibrionales bacterium]
MSKHQIQIRFNTDKEKINASLPAWRVLVDGREHLAESVRVEVPMWTTEDLLPTGQRKWHLTCEGEVYGQGGDCTIR